MLRSASKATSLAGKKTPYLLMGMALALVQLTEILDDVYFCRIAYRAEITALHPVGVSVSLRSSGARLKRPLRMRYINSIPAIVVAALLNRFKRSMTFVQDLIFRWCPGRVAVQHCYQLVTQPPCYNPCPRMFDTVRVVASR